MNIERKDTEILTAEILISLTPEDYKEKYEAELQKQGKTLKMKGFRKGKVPRGTLKKMFGKSVMAEVVVNEVNSTLNNYIIENKLKLLGSPMATKDQAQYQFDPYNLESMDFKFEIGLEPDFELKGVGDGTSYLYHDTKITDDMINEDWDAHRKRTGEQKEIEDEIKEDDRVYLQSVELEDSKVKENGWETEVVLLVNLIDDKKVKKTILKSKLGDKIQFVPSKLEKDTEESYVRKQLLKIEDEDLQVNDEFEGTIEKVIRVIPAEINEELFKAYGDGISNEEEAKDKIREHLIGFYKKQGEAIMYRQIQDQLLVLNEFEMPKIFLEKWILSQNPENEERENFSSELDDFVKSLSWTLIKRKLQQKSKVDVSHGEVLDHFVNQIRSYMGGSMADESFLMNTARQLMDNEEQVTKAREAILDDKIFEYVASEVGRDVKEVNKDELSDIIKELNN